MLCRFRGKIVMSSLGIEWLGGWEIEVEVGLEFEVFYESFGKKCVFVLMVFESRGRVGFVLSIMTWKKEM